METPQKSEQSPSEEQPIVTPRPNFLTPKPKMPKSMFQTPSNNQSLVTPRPNLFTPKTVMSQKPTNQTPVIYQEPVTPAKGGSRRSQRNKKLTRNRMACKNRKTRNRNRRH
jgi:hypothetical protein